MKKQQQQQQQSFEITTNDIENPILEEASVVEEKRKRREAADLDSAATDKKLENDDWFLASISSTGVLMKSLNNTRSSIDFAFVLNIRESEGYPPLFTPQDLNCVEEKISAYKSEFKNNFRNIYKYIKKIDSFFCLSFFIYCCFC